jgi:predicted RNase H-like HicB family nuclease
VKSPRRSFTAVIERCAKSRLYVGYVPGFIGAHTQGATLEELRSGLCEVVTMLFEDGEPEFEAEFVGTLEVAVV